jgi:predicted dehydrogenase
MFGHPESDGATRSRRAFLRGLTYAGAGLAAGPLVLHGGERPSALLRAAVMGLGRGMALVEGLQSLPNVEVAWVCDVDTERLNHAREWINARQTRPAQAAADVRRALEDPELDLLAIAAPNHWHAPATILACAAGKHVYVEKPGSHNLQEAGWMVAAARKHRRQVQLGVQRRSWPGVREMVERLQGGLIGRITAARCWYSNARASIGRGKPVPVPANLNFELWQGPAPEHPYVDNLVHYNWHWRWPWGGGELANNGVHALDLAGWALGAVHPRRVTFNGGRYHFDDDQETPDTGTAVFDFGRFVVMWDNSSCVVRGQENLPFVAFYGEGGCVTQQGGGYKVFDTRGKEVGAGGGPGGDRVHLENFVDAIRGQGALNAEIADGQNAARWCHLGNIAYRLGRTLDIHTADGTIENAAEASKLLGRDYRPGWKPSV